MTTDENILLFLMTFLDAKQFSSGCYEECRCIGIVWEDLIKNIVLFEWRKGVTVLEIKMLLLIKISSDPKAKFVRETGKTFKKC